MLRSLAAVVAVWLALTPSVAGETSLMDRLAAATTPGQRSELLDSDPPAVTASLLEELQKRANAAFARYDYASAQPLFRAVLAVAERLGNVDETIRSHLNIGRCLYRTGKLQEAIQSYHEGLKLSSAANRDALSAALWRSVSATLQNLGNMPEALAAAEESLKFYRAVNDQSGIAGATFNMGNSYFQMGQHRRAAETYEECLRIAEATHDSQMFDMTLKNLASLYSEQGDYAVALSYMERVIQGETFLKGESRGLAATYSILGIIYRRLGRYDEALKTIDKGLPLARQSGDQRLEANLLSARGTVLYYMHRNGEALAAYQECNRVAAQAQAIWPQIYALNDMALMHLEMHQPKEGLVEALEALTLARQMDSPSSLWGPLNAAGKLYLQLNRRAEAEAAFREAIRAIESWRTQIAGGEQEGRSFFSGMLAPYQESIAMRVEDHDPEGALGIAERARAHQLLDVLTRGKVQITQAMSAQEKDREQALSKEAAKWNDALIGKPHPSAALLESFRKAAGEFQAFRSALYAAHPELKVRRGEAEPIGLAEAGALLPDAHAMLLEYALTESAVYLFVLELTGAKPTLTVHKLPVTGKALEKRVAEFHDQLATRDLAYRATAQSLYRDLLGPVSLKNKTIIGVIPDGPLWDLPFQALIAPGGKTLLEQVAVFYAPSLTALREGTRMHRRRPAERTLLAMAPSEKDLPQATAEVRALGRLYGKGSDIYVGQEASEQRWKDAAPRYRVLHLATHGVLNGNNPMFSYLKLSPDGAHEEDGMLEAREIMDLDLQAELAVLSACETARGELRSGEGTIGMSWAMMMAGTPTVVVSQWTVDSASTSELMQEFHRNLRSGMKSDAPLRGKAEALRQAAIKLMSLPQYRHPYYWAGFQVLGDGY